MLNVTTKGSGEEGGDEEQRHVYTYNTSLMSDSDFSLLLNLVTVVVGRLFEINFVIWVHPSLFPPSLPLSLALPMPVQSGYDYDTTQRTRVARVGVRPCSLRG